MPTQTMAEYIKAQTAAKQAHEKALYDAYRKAQADGVSVMAQDCAMCKCGVNTRTLMTEACKALRKPSL